MDNTNDLSKKIPEGIDESLAKEYKEFLLETKKCNFQQSIEWSNLKEFWKKRLVVSRNEEGKIVGGVLLWIRSIKLVGTIIYVARGPVCDSHDRKVLEDLTKQMKQIAKEENAMAILMEPDILDEDTEFKKIAKDLGYKIDDNSKSFKDQINPRFVFRLNLEGKTEEQLLKEFHQKTRYNVRYAKRKGVEIYEGTKDDLKDFQRIMEETGKRDDFGIRNLEYFEKMYDYMGKEHFKLLMAKHEEDVIAGIILITYGNKVWYLYGASSNTKRNLMPNYLLQWNGIKYAKEYGADIYDFRGVPGVIEGEKDHPQYGLYRFKKGFNADFTEFVGQVYLPIKPLTYKFFMWGQKTNRKYGGAIGKVLGIFKRK